MGGGSILAITGGGTIAGAGLCWLLSRLTSHENLTPIQKARARAFARGLLVGGAVIGLVLATVAFCEQAKAEAPRDIKQCTGASDPKCQFEAVPVGLTWLQTSGEQRSRAHTGHLHPIDCAAEGGLEQTEMGAWPIERQPANSASNGDNEHGGDFHASPSAGSPNLTIAEAQMVTSLPGGGAAA